MPAKPKHLRLVKSTLYDQLEGAKRIPDVGTSDGSGDGQAAGRVEAERCRHKW
jgi:hypothetical protein